MSKIFFKVNNKTEEKKQKEESPVEEVAEPAKEEAAVSSPEAVQIALFPGDEQPAPAAVPAPSDEKPEEPFDKQKIIKYFKKHPKKAVSSKVDRFSPKLNKGLDSKQVETRFKQFLFNDTNKKYSRSYASIFIGNICTFFNLLCLFAFIALVLANTQLPCNNYNHG